MKRNLFPVIFILFCLAWLGYAVAAKAGVRPFFGGEYTNLCGTGTAATSYINSACPASCDINSGTCSGNAVYKYVCDGRTSECRSNESGPSNFQSLDNPGCGKTVQLDVFSKNCRNGAGDWICNGLPSFDPASDVKGYIVWYSGDCQVSAPTPTPAVVFVTPTPTPAPNISCPAGFDLQVINSAFACVQRITPTPTPTVPVVFPTATPTPVVAAPIVTPTPPAAINARVNCPDGFVKTISGSNIICMQQVQNQQQSTSSFATAETGAININVVRPAALSTVSKQVILTGAELPKTGLPEAAWLLSGLAPVGYGLQKFKALKKIGDSAHSIWQMREFNRE